MTTRKPRKPRPMALDELAAALRSAHWNGDIIDWEEAPAWARSNWLRSARKARELLVPKRGRRP